MELQLQRQQAQAQRQTLDRLARRPPATSAPAQVNLVSHQLIGAFDFRLSQAQPPRQHQAQAAMWSRQRRAPPPPPTSSWTSWSRRMGRRREWGRAPRREPSSLENFSWELSRYSQKIPTNPEASCRLLSDDVPLTGVLVYLVYWMELWWSESRPCPHLPIIRNPYS